MSIHSFLSQHIHKAWQHKGLLSTLLLPLACITKRIVQRKRHYYQQHPEAVYTSHTPVIVVGNLVVGGAGKTPVVLALIAALRQHGYTPGVISRGYGVRIGEHAHLSAHSSEANYLGDEPSLIAKETSAPVAVHPKRILALQALNRAFPHVDVVIADDGLQHLQLGRAAQVIVQDARGLGNGRLIPAGPLRDLPSQLQHADVIVTQQTGSDISTSPEYIQGVPHVGMQLWPTAFRNLETGQCLTPDEALALFSGKTVGAVAAIGQPQRFFSMLRKFGVNPRSPLSLPDHYDYSYSPFGKIDADFILITPKDAVKCKKFADKRIWITEVSALFSRADWYTPLLEILQRH